jgi:hypothetical protein
MARPKRSPWLKVFERSMATLTRHTLRAGSKAVTQALDKTLKPAVQRRKPPPGAGDWLPGVAMGPSGMRRFQL